MKAWRSSMILAVLMPVGGLAQEAAGPADAAADADTTVVGENPYFTEPRALAMVSPSYPDAAVQAGLEGSVVVCFRVAVDGTVGDAYVLSSTREMFDEPAVEAALASRFEPAKNAGRAVEHDMCLRYRFRL